MKLKKILSMALAVLMVMMVATAALPTTVFAATGTYKTDAEALAAGMKYRIGALDTTNGNTYADTIVNALATFTSATETVTIYQLADVTDTTTLKISSSTVSNVIIDGGNFSYTSSGTNYNDWSGVKSVTIQNFNTFKVGRAIRNSSGMDLTFKNVKKLTTTDRPFIWYNAASGTNTIEFNNSTIDVTCGENGLKIGNEGNAAPTSELTVKMINSTLMRTGSTNSGVNNALFSFGGAKTINVTIDGNSKLIAKNTNNGTMEAFQEGSNGANTAVTVTLEKGAQLISDGTQAAFIVNVMNSKSTLVDNGAEYVVKASTANNSTYQFPNFEGKKFVCGSTSIAAGGTYTKTSAQTTDMIFTMADASAITSDADAVANGMYFRVGAAANKVYKGDFGAAVDAAAEGDTIYLLGNAAMSSKVINKKNLTLDGQGFTLSISSGYGIDVRATGFKVNNATLVFAAQGFSISPAVSDTEFVFTLEDTTVTSGVGVALNYCHNRNGTITDATTAKLVMKNSSLKCIGKDSEDVILLNNKAKFDVEITGSTLSVYTEKSSTTWGRVICVGGAASGTNITITNSTLSTSYNKKAQIIDTQTPTNITMTNTTLEIKSDANTDATPMFIEATGSNGAYTLIDNGITYKASPSALAKEVKFPTKLAEGETLLGYSTSVGLVGDTYTNATATEAMSFTALTFNSADFANVDGAGIRTDAPIGIRFTANVSKELYDALVAADANVEFGMVIAPTRLAFGQNFFDTLFTDGSDVAADKYANVANVKLTDVTVDDVAMKQFRAAIFVTGNENLTNVTDTVLTTKMSACAYFTVHYADGTTATIWADYSAANNSRSICDVAMAYVADGNERKGIIDSILTICGK